MAPETLLEFWFGDYSCGIANNKFRSRWFVVDSKFDAACTSEFEPALRSVKAGGVDDWLSTSLGQLAYIILCDQLPRNIYRGQADAFAWDNLAIETAKRGIEAGTDRQLLSGEQRSFYYMPFEHSENLLDQQTCVGLFSQLRDESPQEQRQVAGNSLRFAQKHRDIILQFGRFPHRNKALTRTSTDAELNFVASGDGFGQLS